MSIFFGLSQKIEKFFPTLELNLLYARIKKDTREFIAIALQKTLIFFIFSLIILLGSSFYFGFEKYLFMISIAIFFSFFFFFKLILAPNFIAARRIATLEKNLIPALQSFYIQINSGIPLFEILANISKANYGEVAVEFGKAVGQINAGKAAPEALEEIAVENPSLYFRRSLWLIINGMRSGADLSITVEQAIHLLSEQKLIQIQNYGARLSPLTMFYMLVGIILPALSIIFIILFVSLINIELTAAKGIFYGFYTFIFLFQIMFLGMINMRRPSLV